MLMADLITEQIAIEREHTVVVDLSD